jgi:hypothetical protein
MTTHTGILATTTLLCAGLILSACGGSSAIAAAPVTTTPPPPAASATRGTLMADVFGAYPRLVRQSHHPDAALNGRLIASMSSTEGGQPVGAIYGSRDDGKTFSRIGAIADPELKHGMCCGTLYELPVKIGALPAGTLAVLGLGRRRARRHGDGKPHLSQRRRRRHLELPVAVRQRPHSENHGAPFRHLGA